MHISYTKQAANAVRYAAKKAKEMKHPYIGTEHLLLGLREEFSGVAGQVLAQNGVETEKIMQLMDELIAPRRRCPHRRNRKKVQGFAISSRTVRRKRIVSVQPRSERSTCFCR